MSKTFPSTVQTGSSKGDSESPQQMYGSFANGIFLTSFFPYQSYFIYV